METRRNIKKNEHNMFVDYKVPRGFSVLHKAALFLSVRKTVITALDGNKLFRKRCCVRGRVATRHSEH